MKQLLFLVFATSFFCCCTPKSTKSQIQTKEPVTLLAPRFNADSAYQYIEKQSLFGPRVPNTKAHVACGDYLVSQLKRFGAEVYEQKVELTNFEGTKLKARNIIGSYNTDKTERVLLLSHWDSRPYADNDPNKANHKTPILGVNDGASGVGVLLEIARMISQKMPNIGVDILFVDAEDMGAPYFFKGKKAIEEDWCLGSQYWAKNPHKQGYKARFGILLDMVGAGDATFYKDLYSVEYASTFANKVWEKGQALGYGQYFKNGTGGNITDDHVYVNTIANIPCLDIIHFSPQSPQGFPSHWHTIDDTMKNISKPTLTAVGQTVAEIVWGEK